MFQMLHYITSDNLLSIIGSSYHMSLQNSTSSFTAMLLNFCLQCFKYSWLGNRNVKKTAAGIPK